ncbi:MAG: Spy/CpxP family protein refolding chaperone [Opitutales bacterium]|nr:Spy/CpxP family protein refolding chaperone [Opitutales bacterium]
MKTVSKITLVCALSALCLASSLNAARPGRGGDSGFYPHHRAFAGWSDSDRAGFHGARGMTDPGMRLIQMGSRLDLSDEQETAILALSQKYRTELETNREKAVALRKAVRDAMQAEALDESALRAALDAMHPVMTEGAVMRARYRHEISQVLTEEQRTKLEALRDRLGKRFDGKKDGRFGRDGRSWGPRGDRGAWRQGPVASADAEE